MKPVPSPDRYTLPFGVFLFLGYSRKEEIHFQPNTHKTVRDHTVAELQRVMDSITRRDQLSPPDDQVRVPFLTCCVVECHIIPVTLCPTHSGLRGPSAGHFAQYFFFW